MSSVKTTELPVLIKLYFPILLSLALLTTGCSIYPQSTRHTDNLRKPDRLRKDVDYTNKKLNDLHGRLYWYIDETTWKHELDSLKETITAPMTSDAFYMKFSPVIASLKQGHTQLFPLLPIDTYRKLMAYEKGKGTPLHYFGFEIFDDRLYITENKRNYAGIKIGTEVVSIGGLDPAALISDYQNTFASDGFNQTYPTHRLGKQFASYFILRTGMADSIPCQLKFHDTIQEFCLMQSKKANPDSMHLENKTVLTKDNVPNRYRPAIKWKSGSLQFPDPDSSTAILKVEDFSGRNFDYFLQYCFDLLRKSNTQNLILDIRDNPGGSAKQAADLYNFLSPEPVPFLDEITVQRKTSLMHTPYYDGQSFSNVVILTIFLPFRLLGLSGSYFAVKRNEDDAFYLKTHLSKPSPPVPNQFHGPVYVMINGGTFSSASLLSSNLKGSGRATFVGEETGGAYNGAVAGSFARYQLPASNLKIVFGLALIQPHYKTDIEGRGIFPYKEITPTIEDRINEIDPELNWIMDQIHTDIGKY